MNNRLEFNENVAARCGVRESVIATYLWDTLWNDEESLYRHGRLWTRMSHRMIVVALPFLTVDMVSRSLQKLKNGGIIKADVFNEDSFDHTSWYTFTDIGREMMES